MKVGGVTWVGSPDACMVQDLSVLKQMCMYMVWADWPWTHRNRLHRTCKGGSEKKDKSSDTEKVRRFP